MLNQSERLGTERIGSLLYRMSVPTIAGMVVNGLYNVIDTIFIGRGVGPLAIGGLAIAFPIQMLAVGIASLVGIGAASSVSRNLGAKNDQKARDVAGNAYVLIVAISLVFSALGLLFTDPLLRIFGGTDNLIPFARDYVRIIFMGNVFFSITMTVQYLLKAEGSPKIAMISSLIGGVLNIALDPVFIFGFKMGIEGAAYATIISQFVAFLYVGNYLFRSKSPLKVTLPNLRPRIKTMVEICSVGSSAFARTTTNIIFLIVINNSLKLYGGDMAITTFGIVNRIVAFLFLPILGVVQGMQPIVGYNHGANQIPRVKEALKLAIIASTAIAMLGWIVGQAVPHLIIQTFTSDPTIIATGSMVFRIVTATIPLLGIQFVGATLFQALGKSIPAIVLSLLRQFILLTPLTLILPRIRGMGLMGVWIAFPVADVIAAIITIGLLKSEISRLDQTCSHPTILPAKSIG